MADPVDWCSDPAADDDESVPALFMDDWWGNAEEDGEDGDD